MVGSTLVSIWLVMDCNKFDCPHNVPAESWVVLQAYEQSIRMIQSETNVIVFP